MRKSLIVLTAAVATLLVLNACQPKKDEGSGGTYAATPVQNCNVPGNTNCNPGVYREVGPQTQDYQWSYSGGFCGCNDGYRPIMNQQWGISCAPSNWFPQSSYYSYNYNTVAYQSQNTQWMSIPQVTYNPVVSGNTTNCYANAASVCDTRKPDTCGDSGVCRQSAGGSYLGFCTTGTGNESYSQEVCNWEWDNYQGYVRRCRTNYSGGSNGTGSNGQPR